MNRTNNSIKTQKENILQVEDYAMELASKYGNRDFVLWYIKNIHIIGIPRTRELEARSRDAKNPAKFFSILLKQEANMAKLKSIRSPDG